MKKIKGKYIRLTENDLQKIIKETLTRVILEYALHRADFLKKCANLASQIITNYCLIRYCTLSSENINQCKNHWKNELYSHMSNISRDKLKKNNSYDARFQTIHIAFEDSECIEVNDIRDEIAFKFQEENILIDNNNIFQQVCEDCSKSINEIINIIALGNPHIIREFIDKI